MLPASTSGSHRGCGLQRDGQALPPVWHQGSDENKKGRNWNELSCEPPAQNIQIILSGIKDDSGVAVLCYDNTITHLNGRV